MPFSTTSSSSVIFLLIDVEEVLVHMHFTDLVFLLFVII